MPERTFPNLGMKAGYDIGEDGWGDSMTENLLRLSVLAQASVISKVSATPGMPANGDIYLFDETHPTEANAIAVFENATWTYIQPIEGWLVYNKAENYYEKFGATWSELETGGGGGGGDISEIGQHRYWMLTNWSAIQNRLIIVGASALELRSSIGGAALPVTASSATDTLAGYPTSNLFDGNAGTLWVTETATNACLFVDLGVAERVLEVAWTGRNDAFWHQSPRAFDLFFSDDNEKWQLAGRVVLDQQTGAAQTSVSPVCDSLIIPQSGLRMIEKVTTTGSQADVTFSAIPDYYESLEVEIMARGDTGATTVSLLLQFNGDSGGNYARSQFVSNGAGGTAAQGGYSNTSMEVAIIAASMAPAGKPGIGKIMIPNYAGALFHKSCLYQSFYTLGNNAGGQNQFHGGGNWADDAAINALKLFCAAGNFVDGSTITLWGRR